MKNFLRTTCAVRRFLAPASVCIAMVLGLLASSSSQAGDSFFGSGLRVEVSKGKDPGSLEAVETEQLKGTVTSEFFSLVLENPTSTNYEDLDVQYRLFFDDAYPSPKVGSAQKLMVPGSAFLRELSARSRVDLETQRVEVKDIRLKQGWVYEDRSKPRVADRLRGIWIKVVDRNGEILLEKSWPGGIESGRSWHVQARDGVPHDFTLPQIVESGGWGGWGGEEDGDGGGATTMSTGGGNDAGGGGGPASEE